MALALGNWQPRRRPLMWLNMRGEFAQWGERRQAMIPAARPTG